DIEGRVEALNHRDSAGLDLAADTESTCRRRSHVVTAAMNAPSTKVVRAGSIASLARKLCDTVSTHCRTGTYGTTSVTRRAAKSHMRRPMQLGQKPRR